MFGVYLRIYIYIYICSVCELLLLLFEIEMPSKRDLCHFRGSGGGGGGGSERALRSRSEIYNDNDEHDEYQAQILSDPNSAVHSLLYLFACGIFEFRNEFENRLDEILRLRNDIDVNQRVNLSCVMSHWSNIIPINEEEARNSEANVVLTPLHFAAAALPVVCINVLIAKGADMEARDSCGRTALLIAARNRNVMNMQALLDYPDNEMADFHALDSEGNSVFANCILGPFKKRGFPTSRIFTGANRSLKDCIDFLIKNDGKPEPKMLNVPNDYGMTPLCLTESLDEREEVVEMLLDAGAK